MATTARLLLTGVLTLAWALPAGADAPGDLLGKAPSKFAKYGGVRVHYKSLGEGKAALVFVHGWCCDLTFWRYQVPALDGKVRLVLIDLPGHGKSDRPKREYTMDFFARAVNAVLADAGVEKAVLAGHSMGTPVVRQFYRLYPKKTAGLIAVDGRLRGVRAKPEELKKFVEPFSGPDFKKTVHTFFDRMVTKDTPEEVRKHLKERAPAAPQHVAVSAMKSMFDPAIWKDDPIKVPLLVIVAKSPFWTAEYEKYVRKLAPKVDYRVMEGVGHFLMMEKPREFNALVLGFLKKQGWVKG
jgi:pimeloyl-ACP methyl ester carboxylesterase